MSFGYAVGAAVPGDEFDVGVPFEPAGQRGRRSIREEVDHAVPIEVDNDRAITAALPDRPIADADPERTRRVGHRDAGGDLQHGRAARRHVEVREESCAACTAAGDADPGLRLAKPPRAPDARCEKCHGRLDGGLTSAGRVAAVEPPHLNATAWSAMPIRAGRRDGADDGDGQTGSPARTRGSGRRLRPAAPR